MSDQLSRVQDAVKDRYRIERRLGAGGMATVYLAEDMKLQRRVAIKVLKPALSALLGADRFLKEIELTANLQHPNVLPLHDSGETAGVLYYVMPYVEGETLQAKLQREGQLAADDALAIAEAVARALDHAHERGVVHRDIKPGNVLLSGGEAMLADFGIAIALSAADEKRLTETGISIGTPDYMSPEQAAGDRSVDHRSDVYALACLLYEMLAGRPPFGGTTEEVIRQHVAAVPPPVTAFRDGVAEPVAAALRKSLSKAPADRHDSAGAFIAAARVDSVRWKTLRSPLTLALAAGVLVVVAVTGAALSRDDPTSAVPRVAVMPFENVARNEAFAHVGEAVRRSIIDGVAQLTVIEVVPIDGDAGDASLQVGGAFVRRGDSVEFVFDLRDRRADRTLPAPEPVRAPAAEPLAALETIRNRVMAALSHYQNAFAVAVASGRRPISSYDAYLAFDEGLQLMYRFDYGGAELAFRRAVALEPRYTEAYMWLGGAALRNQPGATTARGGVLGRWREIDSLAAAMETVIDPLTAVDRNFIEILRAQVRGDMTTAMRLALVGAQDFMAASNLVVGVFGVESNHPEVSRRALESMDATEGWLKEWIAHDLFLTQALHQLGDFEAELRAGARRGWTLFPWIGMGQLDSVRSASRNLGPFDAVRVGLELRAHGHRMDSDRVLQAMVERQESRSREGPPFNRMMEGIALAVLQRLNEAEATFLALMQADTARLDYRGLLGIVYAQRGDRTAADSVDRALAAIHEPYLFGLPALWRARIASMSGKREEAVELLGQAFAEGTRHDNRFPGLGSYWHSDPWFEALRDYGPFRDLVRPKMLAP